MNTRRIIGIVIGVTGVIIATGHYVLAFFSSTPERYHGHEALVGVGFALIVIGILLIGTDKQR